jgi:hypothetical protein
MIRSQEKKRYDDFRCWAQKRRVPVAETIEKGDILSALAINSVGLGKRFLFIPQVQIHHRPGNAKRLSPRWWFLLLSPRCFFSTTPPSGSASPTKCSTIK